MARSAPRQIINAKPAARHPPRTTPTTQRQQDMDLHQKTDDVSISDPMHRCNNKDLKN